MRIRFQPGYTLIEMLFYIALCAVLFLFLTDIIINMLQGKTRLDAVNEITQANRDSIGRIRLAVRNAAGVTTPALSATSSQLVLQMDNVALNPTIFRAVSGTLMMKEGTQATSTLTGAGFAIRSLVFRNLSATGTPATIRIEMFSSSTNSNSAEVGSSGQPLYGTVVVRQRL